MDRHLAWYESHTPTTQAEAWASFHALWGRLARGEAYGRRVKDHMSRLGEWMAANGRQSGCDPAAFSPPL